jgi:dTDP-4-dehydrorhamnose reductase
MPRIAIIGHSGVVGSALHRAAVRGALEITTASRSRDADVTLDLANPAMDLKKLAGCETIYLCAALTNVDFCEQNIEASRSINVDGPAQIAGWCARNGAKLVFFSSDYVFDGRHGPYDENAATNPINVYGRHKAEAEDAIARILPERHAVIRTTVVFGIEAARRNFAMRLFDELRAGRAMNVPDDQIGTPTWSNALAEATLRLLRGGAHGVFHAAGPSRMSRYNFALRAAEILGLDCGLIHPVSTASLHQSAPRPFEAGLVSVKVPQLPSLDAALRSFAMELRGGS